MIVRAVEIDQKVSQGAEHGEGAGRAVDELSACALGGQYALKKKPPVFASLCAMTVQQGRDPFIAGVLEDGLDRTGLGVCTNELPVRALSKDERQRAKNNGFARSGFSGDGDKSRPGLPYQFVD